MMASQQVQQPTFPPPSTGIPVEIPADSSVWGRISTWVSEHKAVVYTIAGVTVAVAAGGVIYYSTNSVRGASQRLISSSSAVYPSPSMLPRCVFMEDRTNRCLPNQTSKDTSPKLSKKERRKRKEAERKAEAERNAATKETSASASQVSGSDSSDEIPEITEETVLAMTPDERKHWAIKLKEAGNHAYGSKDFNKAIELYTKAITCKPEAVYYSNRAACFNALADWEKVVEDTTAAINLDPEYVKAMNRRANAYDKLEKYSESLLDYTASCIIDGFKNASSAEAVERLLKKFAESKAKEIMANKPRRLPSPTFVSNYLQSFRPKPRPEGLEDSVEVPTDTGKGQLQAGLRAMEKKTGEGYEEAAAAFDRAIELDDLGPYEAFAYNMRGTFTCLRGKHEQALADLTKSAELDPSMTQSYIKRASMSLELGKKHLFTLAHRIFTQLILGCRRP